MVDLICFPGAGAGASIFRPWVSRVPAFTAVVACQLPGRENRIDEPPPSSLADAANEVVAAYLAIRPTHRPFVLFGHSMGGTLAVEVAYRLAAIGRFSSAVMLSASAPPTVASESTAIDDTALRNLLIGYDPENQRITGNEELYAALAPVLGSDIAMLRRHEVLLGIARIEMSVYLMSGNGDAIVPVGSVARWSKYFAGEISQLELEGGHFFPFRESQDLVLDMMSGVLRAALVGRRRG